MLVDSIHAHEDRPRLVPEECGRNRTIPDEGLTHRFRVLRRSTKPSESSANCIRLEVNRRCPAKPQEAVFGIESRFPCRLDSGPLQSNHVALPTVPRPRVGINAKHTIMPRTPDAGSGDMSHFAMTLSRNA